METIATQVHNKIAREMIKQELLFNEETLITKEQEKLYESILKFGGVEVENVKNYLSKKEKDNTTTSLNQLKKKVSELQLNPRWKIITYGSLMNILREHNLVLGPLTKYIKEIPSKNAKEMIDYCDKLRTQYTLYPGTPLFNFDERNNYSSDRLACVPIEDIRFYVCASIDNFKKQNRHKIGEEIFYDASLKPPFEFEVPNPDPIVVSPLIWQFGNQRFLLIDVVTSWDREAGLIVNEMEN